MVSSAVGSESARVDYIIVPPVGGRRIVGKAFRFC
jgi:hypothetical protein